VALNDDVERGRRFVGDDEFRRHDRRQRDVLSMIREIQREMGSSFMFVTHDMGVHATVSDSIGIVYDGRLVEEAPTAKLFNMPLHPYTQHLV
ncbi:hypothetical protein AB9F42_34270, partial [Rhizobium leguminosarum]